MKSLNTFLPAGLCLLAIQLPLEAQLLIRNSLSGTSSNARFLVDGFIETGWTRANASMTAPQEGGRKSSDPEAGPNFWKRLERP